MNSVDVADPDCPQCHGHVQIGDRFCGMCGQEIFGKQQASTADHNEDVFEILQPTLAYYGVTLILLAAYKLTSAFPEGFEGMVAITVIDTAIVLIFWLLFYRQLLPLFSLKDVKSGLLLVTVISAMAGSVVVSVVADFINISISDDVFYSTYLFEDSRYPLFFAVLFIAVHPAIFEEVAFRGFLFNNVSRVTTARGAICVTGFVFGIIHLSVISLLWLVPIGLIFAWLRWKHNTLWYGIVGHFVYNFCITMMDYYGWTLF
jgi:uncharacterized protein